MVSENRLLSFLRKKLSWSETVTSRFLKMCLPSIKMPQWIAPFRPTTSPRVKTLWVQFLARVNFSFVLKNKRSHYMPSFQISTSLLIPTIANFTFRNSISTSSLKKKQSSNIHATSKQTLLLMKQYPVANISATATARCSMVYLIYLFRTLSAELTFKWRLKTTCSIPISTTLLGLLSVFWVWRGICVSFRPESILRTTL